MKKKIQSLLIFMLLLFAAPLAFVQPAQAQATLTNTTLSTAVTGTAAQNIVLASSTGVAANYIIVVDHEAMQVSSTYVAGNTTVGIVARGYGGTLSTPHPSGEIVFVGPASYFSVRDYFGSCTAASQTVLPVVSINRSKNDVFLYNCNNGLWAQQALPNDTGGNSTVSAGSGSGGGARVCTPNLYSATTANSGGTLQQTLAYSSFGTNTTSVAGTTYYASFIISATTKLTGISVLNSLTVGNDKRIYTLYRADGVWLASTSITGSAGGTTTSGANAYQDIAFTSTFLATGPARYWIGVQTSSTTDGIRTIPSSSWLGIMASSVTGTFGIVPSSLTTLTTTVANTGPFACVY